MTLPTHHLTWRKVTELADGDKVAALTPLKAAPWNRGQLESIARGWTSGREATVTDVRSTFTTTVVKFLTPSGQTVLTRTFSTRDYLPLVVPNVSTSETKLTTSQTREIVDTYPNNIDQEVTK